MSKNPPDNILLRGITVKHAAAYWGVGSGTFRKLVREGLVPGPISIPGLGQQIFDRVQQEQAFNARLRKGAA
jgi:hypothetical protein